MGLLPIYSTNYLMKHPWTAAWQQSISKQELVHWFAQQISGLVSMIRTLIMKELISKSSITIIPLPLGKWDHFFHLEKKWFITIHKNCCNTSFSNLIFFTINFLSFHTSHFHWLRVTKPYFLTFMAKHKMKIGTNSLVRARLLTL